MRLLICIGVLFTLVSCMGVKKAEKVMRANPTELAKLCLDCFGNKKEIEYIKGDTSIVKIDTTINIDTTNITIVDCPDGTKVECPPNEIRYITKHTHSTDSVFIDTWQTTAKVVILESEVKKQTERANENEYKYNKWRKIALWGWGLIGGVGLAWFVIGRVRNRLF